MIYTENAIITKLNNNALWVMKHFVIEGFENKSRVCILSWTLKNAFKQVHEIIADCIWGFHYKI